MIALAYLAAVTLSIVVLAVVLLRNHPARSQRRTRPRHWSSRPPLTRTST
ncbi:hypothetical protein AB0C84_44885 [Actinomadura sp. NPDC048955]